MSGLRCCRDSVAMWAIAHDEEPHEGQRIDCRWCSYGYGEYTGGRWVFHDDLGERIAASERHIASPAFQRAKAEWKDGK